MLVILKYSRDDIIFKNSVILGISFKTQLLYSIVFLTRYLDLVLKRVSIYNTLMKVFFVASSIYILYLMRYKYQATYDAGLDTFRIEYLLVGSAILGVSTCYIYTVIEVKKKKGKECTHIIKNKTNRFCGAFQFG